MIWSAKYSCIAGYSQTTTDAAGTNVTFVTDHTDYGAAVTVSPPA